jgi:hypothetical protein
MTIYLLIYFYKNKDINLDNYDYLPEFIFTWLKNLKVMTENKEVFKFFLKSEYTQLYLYIFILIFVILTW